MRKDFRVNSKTSKKGEKLKRARGVYASSRLACEQAHFFGWGAATDSWREEWGLILLAGLAGSL